MSDKSTERAVLNFCLSLLTALVVVIGVVSGLCNLFGV